MLDEGSEVVLKDEDNAVDLDGGQPPVPDPAAEGGDADAYALGRDRQSRCERLGRLGAGQGVLGHAVDHEAA